MKRPTDPTAPSATLLITPQWAIDVIDFGLTPSQKWALVTTAQILGVATCLWTFLLGVGALQSGIKLLGSDFAASLISTTATPIVGLFAGMLATVLFQSSSVTTSLIVAMTSSQTLTIAAAIPMIMGANIGTSVTNTIVAVAYAGNRGTDNKSAFAAATIHDYFNLLTVGVALPLELATGFLEKSAKLLSTLLTGTDPIVEYHSPLKASIGPATHFIKAQLIASGLGNPIVSIAMILIAASLIFGALYFIVKLMKLVVGEKQQRFLNLILSKNSAFAIFFGALLTFLVQSSSITTSLLVPMAASGILTVEAIYPVTIGANLGTTTTALIASLAGNQYGLVIAMCHLLFNLFGAILWFPIPSLRRVPINLAVFAAGIVSQSRVYALTYVVGVFFLLPLLLITIFGR